jgi:oxygen-independent coproporphyrinogen III oxidase
VATWGEGYATVDGVSLVPDVQLRPGRPGSAGDPSDGVFDASRPMGVYVHFPFCSVHCPYCDFAVDARAPERVPHQAYADAIIGELQAHAPWFRGPGGFPELRSIYFGGGTPGLWRPTAVARVIQAVRLTFQSGRAELEITVEANPGEVDAEQLRALRVAGVNRISLGSQSFDDTELGAIGRNHDAAAIAPAVAAVRRAGFSNLTCDLMFGLPGQTADSWRRSVEALLALAPDHVSAYALTIERGTPFGALDRAGKLVRPDDDTVAELFRWGRGALAAAGYEPYEVSSYARPGFRAVHNQLYWTQGAYLGLGASAASFRPLADGTAWRFSNPRGTDSYLRACARPGGPWPAKIERRLLEDLENEALWLALRTRDGVDRRAHRHRFGHDPLASEERQREAGRCVRSGWLAVSPHQLRLTDEGVLFADEVAARLWSGS